MRDFSVFCSGIAFHRFEIRILAEQNTLIEAWPGAVLRKKILLAATQVSIPENGILLFDFCCKQLLLPVSHPLYKGMEQGYPPPFYLYTSVGQSGKVPYKIQKNGVLGKAGYQEKSNGFPGFYQFVRSAAYRMEKLTALYYAPDDTEGYMASHREIEHYVEGAASGIWLEDVCLWRVTHQSTRKEGMDKRLVFTGYTGEITFRGDYARYLPLLRCIEQLGIGEKLSYGFGKIRIEEQ